MDYKKKYLKYKKKYLMAKKLYGGSQPQTGYTVDDILGKGFGESSPNDKEEDKEEDEEEEVERTVPLSYEINPKLLDQRDEAAAKSLPVGLEENAAVVNAYPDAEYGGGQRRQTKTNA